MNEFMFPNGWNNYINPNNNHKSKNALEKYILRKNYAYIIMIGQFNVIEDYTDIISKTHTLFFDYNWYKPIENLPECIETIIFHDNSLFNTETKNFPPKLKKIKFGKNFSQPLDYLPLSLEELEFSMNSQYACAIENLPSCLKKLTFGNTFNVPINNLPAGLEILSIHSRTFVHELKNLPENLMHLHMNMGPNLNMLCDYAEIKNIPPKLQSITYPYNYSYPIANLPQSVKVVRVSRIYSQDFLTDLKKSYPDKKIFVY